MAQLFAGFARVDITPVMGLPLDGYYIRRESQGVLDELSASAVALSMGDTRAVIISVDHLGLEQEWQKDIRAHISRRAGVPIEGVFVACTHTHTAPSIRKAREDSAQAAYLDFLKHRLADAAQFAVNDLKRAKIGCAIGQAPNIAFIRRFRMKDGSIRTNPGVNNPDILAPMGMPDERVSVIRIDREGAKSIVIAHFASHPDTIGGVNVSADWLGFARKFVERDIENTHCVVLNGAEGDVNHVNAFPKAGDLNDLTNDFDDVMRGYGHARHMGRAIAGAVCQVYDKVNYFEPKTLKAMQRTLRVKSNMPSPEEIETARVINKLHTQNRDDEIPFTGMMLTTVVAEAERMIKLEHGPQEFELTLSAIAIGDTALIGIPGEPFTQIGVKIKQAEAWRMVLPCSLTNGNEGYFPTLEAYQEGGYESRSSIFKSGVAETIINAALDMLSELKAL